MSQKPPRNVPRQVWFVAAMVVVLLVLLVPILLGKAPRSPAATAQSGKLLASPSSEPAAAAVHQGTSEATTAVKVPSVTPSATATTAATRTATASPSPTRTATTLPTRTPTLPASPTPSATATPQTVQRSDHYWLARPIAAQSTDYASHFYPYASRGDGSYPIHHGVEFVNPTGTAILATAPGRIVVAGNDDTQVYGARNEFYGLVVIQELDRTLDGEPLYVLYGHLSEIHVQVGDRVETGDTVGLVGMTGVAMGPHLHLEVRYGQNTYAHTVNPELWIQPHEGFGSLAGLVADAEGDPVPEVRMYLYQASTGRMYREIYTYPQKPVNPDPVWRENFGTGYLPAGDWVLELSHRGRIYRREFTVESGATTWVEIQTAL